jgi:hypothetical protein
MKAKEKQINNGKEREKIPLKGKIVIPLSLTPARL